MGHILWTKPVFKEMIWGGHKLKDVYGYDIPSNQTGECWAISAHRNGDCQIIEGEFAGQTLSQVFAAHRELFGNIQDEQFPLLVKIIDACNDLSVQVHPDDEYAKIHENSLGKTECWYVLDCDQNTQMVMGHHAKTKEELIQDIENDDYDHLLNSFEIHKGDFFYIPSGTIHAICKGSLIYEAQQSSDITYRVYDYHRKDNEGKERELHVQQSIDVTTVPFKPYSLEDRIVENFNHGTRTQLVSSQYLTLNKYDLNGSVTIENNKPFQLVSIVEGEGVAAGKKVKKGDHFVVCSDQKSTDFNGNMTVMICTL